VHLEQYFTITNAWEIFFLSILGIVVLLRLFFYVFFYARILKKPKPLNSSSLPLSVIIAAHNEAENLRQFLPKILEQIYPQFEVIVVNDRSDDESNDVLVEYRSKYPNLYFTNIEENPRFPSGKKLALTVGIKAAKYEHLVFTDADCYPESKNWLQSISQNYTPGIEIVLGYGGYADTGKFLNTIIRYETFKIGLQYLTFAKSGMPYMAVGRNLSYLKQTYDTQKGFASHYHIKSGDDDLFVNKAANRKNTAATWHPESRTRSISKTTFDEYVLQKVRHFSTWKHYRFLHKFVLTSEILTRFFYYTGLIFALIMNIPVGYLISIYGLTVIVQCAIVGIAAKRLGEKRIAWFEPIFDILMPLIHLRISISGFFIRKRIQKRWN